MSSRAGITKKACDGCKIRKIRCGGGQPCQSCSNARIKCTYIRVQQPRGPQKLRATTKYLIDQAQRGFEVQNALPSASGRGEVREADDAIPNPAIFEPHHSLRSRIPINILASPLYIYHVRMYQVWPIVDVENVLSILQQDTEEKEHEMYALATAVAAATIAQLRLGQNSPPEKSLSAENFALESMRARRLCDYRSRLNLNNVRTAFFLHVYYENQQSGASESLLYLREAITLAQMMSLHREASYVGLPAEEQQLRRRVLWLLFVTERGVCILHKLPVILKTNVSTPALDTSDEPQVLPAFLKLLNLFRLFEQSRMFELIEEDHGGRDGVSDEVQGVDARFLRLLQENLQDGSVLLDHISDVQKADLCVTRHWMRMILWKFSFKQGLQGSHSSQWSNSPSFPVLVAKELLNIVSQLPRTAIEAHGLGMELKLYEIASSLADAVINLAMLPQAPVWDGESRPSSILARLHSILSTFRGGGNKELVDLLYRKMADAQFRTGPALPPPIHEVHSLVRVKDKPPTATSGGETPVPQLPASTLEDVFTTTDPTSTDSVADWSAADDDPYHQAAFLTSDHHRTSTRGDGLVPDQSGISAQPPLHSLGDLAPSSLFGASFSAGLGYAAAAAAACAYDPYLGITGTHSPLLQEARESRLDISSLSPSLPSESVEMWIGDFISQSPRTQVSPENYFCMANELADPSLSSPSFLA
ncbi:Zn(II)2Cys6 transcription factor [Aspergillus homomorphus CBS 101889]|uniref:C6 transcription factor n=1 Tax=Aspergillus homomorphus (strain CBS 101889) TaxID=1450537 RepID=A0A395IAA8_ASPHC|nr:C6 transcription factor [Aspergillus homomorphus CBS 101889]RAL16961.1 C6 transcription factor [Aspergillus homomorphus CBS 101889]